jgi:oligopeptide/dipeptide ABC transporter ATP-binding protein
MPKLEVKNLQISFRTNNGAVRAVRDISFRLNEGETLAIVGESGSGKSVTARAIMGILAGNAMVDNGEIIYDGQDLLKISEDDFHTLRGHKLAMIFQDPLSALNPIMRVGKQLTEAMILNNKERRRDGKRRFKRMVALLEKNAIAAYAAEGLDRKDATREKIGRFKKYVEHGVRLQNVYNAAREALIESSDLAHEVRLEIKRNSERTAREALGRLGKALKTGYHHYLIAQSEAEYQAGVGRIAARAAGFKLRDAEPVLQLLEQLEGKINAALDTPEPAFYALAFGLENGAPLPQGRDILSINQEANDRLQRDFLDDFLVDVQHALTYSHEQSLAQKAAALQVLKDALPVFEKDPLVESECRAAFTKTAAAVDQAIDPMRLNKDNLSYVFRTSMKTNIDRYFRGLTSNPREEARFLRDTQKREKLLKRNKMVSSVVPKNLIDLATARANLGRDVRALIDQYQETSASSVAPTVDDAQALVNYLMDRASEYGYKLTMAMAKHRSIELMDEVGIPEPHKRFKQYPFEFSGGMRQRVVIAIALSANPDILICDEPTTALDVTIQAQILELINNLKKQRNLSVIFITHDLGVVANMADSIAVMYAGKIVEHGTADDVFYNPQHPYTWALLSSVPDLETREKLDAIPGTPPNMIIPPKGDAFAARNHYALEIDFEEQPPMFRVSDTHYAATWLLHPEAPKVEPPAIVRERIARMQQRAKANVQEGGAAL